MTKKELITRAEEAKRNGKIFRCGSKNIEENRTANRTANLITQAVLARKQNG